MGSAQGRHQVPRVLQGRERSVEKHGRHHRDQLHRRRRHLGQYLHLHRPLRQRGRHPLRQRLRQEGHPGHLCRIPADHRDREHHGRRQADVGRLQGRLRLPRLLPRQKRLGTLRDTPIPTPSAASTRTEISSAATTETAGKPPTSARPPSRRRKTPTTASS